MKKIKLIVLLICSGFIVTLIVGVLIDIDYSKNVIKTSDKSLYEMNEYYFLPNYNEFEYKENVTGFYTYDSSNTLIGGSVSYVLELQFATKKVYNEFLEYPLSNISEELLHTTYIDRKK